MRFVLCVLLALVSAPAWAEWTRIGENDQIVQYIDLFRLRKDGDRRQVWELQDLKQRTSDGAMSVQSLSEYDCKKGKYRFLHLSTYPEAMANGKALLWNDKPGDWSYMPPEHAAELILKIVCNPRN